MTSTTRTTAWEELVTSALLGTDRRTPPADLVPPGKEAPVALLDAAALHTVRRRAGLRPAAARPLPEPAPHDSRRALPEPAQSGTSEARTASSSPAQSSSSPSA
ncbi:DUF5691 domain-containing protein, partial [Streptomyces sp. NPDC001514]